MPLHKCSGRNAFSFFPSIEAALLAKHFLCHPGQCMGFPVKGMVGNELACRLSSTKMANI